MGSDSDCRYKKYCRRQELHWWKESDVELNFVENSSNFDDTKYFLERGDLLAFSAAIATILPTNCCMTDYKNPNLLNKSSEARQGRENQRYNEETGARIVAGCICLNETKDKVIMISSSKHKDRWIMPKGGNELDELELETAVRETWEEAGVEGIIIKKLPVVMDSRGQKAPVIKGDFDSDHIPKSEFHFFELQVEQLSTTWPEMKKRERRWCTYSEAKHELLKLKRPELVDALNMSSIQKDTEVKTVDEY